jgi:precorrin-2 dehydrogenase/sirohydrochlorin ferrochelatase
MSTAAKPPGMRERIRRWRDGETDEAGNALDAVRRLLERWRGRGRQWRTRAYYPAILDLSGRNALVVGAGKVGEGKIRGLLNAGARVRVVSLDATEQVRLWASEGRIELLLRPYESADLDGCFLVIAATERSDTNEKVFADAEQRNMLCNVVDVTALCNFILPSIMRRGNLAIGVSTAGASPALARKIRLELEQQYGNEYELALELLGSLRDELKARYPDPHDRKIIFERIVYSDFMDMVRRGDTAGLEAWIERCIEEGPAYAPADEHKAAVAAALAAEPESPVIARRSAPEVKSG